MKRDAAAVQSKSPAELSRVEKGDSFGSLKVVKLQSPDGAPEPFAGSAHNNRTKSSESQRPQPEEESDEPQRRIPLPHEQIVSDATLPTASEKLGSKKIEKKPDKKIPLAYGIEDSDLEEEKSEDKSL